MFVGLRWHVIESGLLSSEAVMAKDADLLKELNCQGSAILHLYDWNEPCLTYGYFTDPTRYLYLDALSELGIQHARRPTGGGIIFHLTDVAFSILLPSSYPGVSVNTFDNYALVNRIVAQAIADFAPAPILPYLLDEVTAGQSKGYEGFCMAKPTQYDIMMNQGKVGGAAQRRTKNGLLHQASVSLLPPCREILEKVLIDHESVLQQMDGHSHYLGFERADPLNLVEARRGFKECLRGCLTRTIAK